MWSLDKKVLILALKTDTRLLAQFAPLNWTKHTYILIFCIVRQTNTLAFSQSPMSSRVTLYTLIHRLAPGTFLLPKVWVAAQTYISLFIPLIRTHTFTILRLQVIADYSVALKTLGLRLTLETDTMIITRGTC